MGAVEKLGWHTCSVEKAPNVQTQHAEHMVALTLQARGCRLHFFHVRNRRTNMERPGTQSCLGRFAENSDCRVVGRMRSQTSGAARPANLIGRAKRSGTRSCGCCPFSAHKLGNGQQETNLSGAETTPSSGAGRAQLEPQNTRLVMDAALVGSMARRSACGYPPGVSGNGTAREE